MTGEIVKEGQPVLKPGHTAIHSKGKSMSILVEGKIPPHKVCPYRDRCFMAKSDKCYHKGEAHNVAFSCGAARAFVISDEAPKGEFAKMTRRINKAASTVAVPLKYPTEYAYTQACKALETHRKRADKAEKEVRKLKRRIDQIKKKANEAAEDVNEGYVQTAMVHLREVATK